MTGHETVTRSVPAPTGHPRFSGRSVCITGGASGLGRAIARLMAAEGAHLVLVDINEDGLAAVAKSCTALGGRAVHVVGDVSSNATALAAVAAAKDTFGGLDVLINNAGIDPLDAGALVDTTDETWDRVMNVNLKSAFLFVRAASPLFQAGACIVNTASTAAILSSPNKAVYGISKAALIALTRSVARDLGARGVRANCVCPGFLESLPGDRRSAMEESVLSEQMQAFAGVVPLGRLGLYSETANAVAFLASDAAAYVNGASLVVDGGMTIARPGPPPRTNPVR